jgi:hypothetical protein
MSVRRALRGRFGSSARTLATNSLPTAYAAAIPGVSRPETRPNLRGPPGNVRTTDISHMARRGIVGRVDDAAEYHPRMGGDLLVVLLVILAIVLVWRGPKNLPKLGAALGRTVRDARREIEAKDDEPGAQPPSEPPDRP